LVSVCTNHGIRKRVRAVLGGDHAMIILDERTQRSTKELSIPNMLDFVATKPENI